MTDHELINAQHDTILRLKEENARLRQALADISNFEVFAMVDAVEEAAATAARGIRHECKKALVNKRGP